MTETKELVFDSSKRNVLSMLLDRKSVDESYGRWYYVMIWAIAAVVFFVVPLMICALTQPSLIQRSTSFRMPFLLDFAAYPMNLVVIPLLLINVIRERRTLNQTLTDYLNGPARGVEHSEIHKIFDSLYGNHNSRRVFFSALAAIAFTYLWSNKFLNDQYITWHSFGTQPVSEGFNSAGYYCAIIMLGVYWFLLVFTVLRGILHFQLFRSISKLSKNNIDVIPIHPDGCGGLKAVSRVPQLYRVLALSIGLTVAGIYATDILLFEQSPLDYLNIVMIFGFILFCVIAFFLPLWPFSNQMRASKKETLKIISDQFEKLWRAEIGKAYKNDDSEIDAKALTNIRSLYLIADQMPVWPYDLKTIRSFMFYVIVPLITIIVSALIRKIIG